MRKLLFLFVALLATTTVFGGFTSISVTDGTAADWDALPAEYVASATHTEGCSLDGLKNVKVFADEASINLLVEWNPASIDLSCVPFHIFINVDPGAETGGFGDYWMDPNDIDLLTEGFIFLDGMPCAYEPGLFAYGGAPGTNEWNWMEILATSSNWINSQHLVGNQIEIQLLKEFIPVQWADEFTIGFEIEQNWWDAGHLPNAADDEIGNTVLAEKLRVQVCHLGGLLPQDGLHYAITSHVEPYTVAVVGTYADITTAIIPETIELYGKTYAVTSIGAEAFADCTSLTSIAIPNSITSIGNYAFSSCSSLTSITIPNSVTSIGNYAFRGCSSLTSITIPNSITEINSGIFEGCSSLTSITIPNSITSIGSEAFWYCSSLTSITIPNSVTSIGNYAFYYCSSLTSITIPNSVTEIGSSAFEGCYSLTSITIPNSVTEIGWNAFSHCTALKSLTIPNSVTKIRDDAFSHCTSLEYLSIPNSVKYAGMDHGKPHYGWSSITDCSNLKTLIVPADFFMVEDEYYQEVKAKDLPYLPERLESLTINDGTIHRLAWDFINRNYKTLKTIDLATTTDIAIAEEAFKNCYKLENLALPSQLEYIPYMAIAECVKLQSITIPATVTEIEDRAFENCRSIKSIIFEGTAPKQGPAQYAAACGSSLWRIGSWAFYNCHQLQNLTIPEGVTEIGDAAFYGCTYLEDMVLPSTIQEIGDNGFALCAKLKKIHVKAATPPTIQAKTFFDVNRQIPVYVPDNAVEAYKDDPYWSEFDIQGESKAPSAVDNIPSAVTNTKKIMSNGQLLILRDGKTYNIMGAEIR